MRWRGCSGLTGAGGSELLASLVHACLYPTSGQDLGWEGSGVCVGTTLGTLGPATNPREEAAVGVLGSD
jgi:hypothetical protein